jgi:H+-transporting ATPase
MTGQTAALKARPSSPNPEDDLKALPMPEVEKRLGSSPNGLTQAEAAKRLTQYGPNEIEEIRTNPLVKFLSYFWGPIPWMIEAAVILSAVVRHWPDFGIIFLLLLANALVGFWEEREAGNAIAALKAKLAINARARRDGKWIIPPARELVPGDVIRLRLACAVKVSPKLLANCRSSGLSATPVGRLRWWTGPGWNSCVAKCYTVVKKETDRLLPQPHDPSRFETGPHA